MQQYQQQFIEFCLAHDALTFGEFTLKSGRVSPYFFNAGQFNTGRSLGMLGHFYSQTLTRANFQFDMLFGPAYKGIPLVATVAIALAEQQQLAIPYSFNRKEAKDHGEGGLIVGHPLQGKVVIVDDVITAGTAISQTIPLIQEAGAELGGIIVMLDRQERGKGSKSAIQEIAETHQVPVLSIINMSHLQEFIAHNENLKEFLPAMDSYRAEYGV